MILNSKWTLSFFCLSSLIMTAETRQL